MFPVREHSFLLLDVFLADQFLENYVGLLFVSTRVWIIESTATYIFVEINIRIILHFSKPTQPHYYNHTQVEFVEFLHGTKAALVAFDSSPKGDTDQFKYWDNSNYAREQYRYLTNTTFTGEQSEVCLYAIGMV